MIRPAGKCSGVAAIIAIPSHLEPIFAPIVESAGYCLVRLRLMGGKRKVLQVMAEREDGTMNVDDCAALSAALSDFLETDDPIEGDYLLEVSSPGIDRPLTRRGDFARWKGHEAKIELTAPLEHDPEKWKPVFGKDHATESKIHGRKRFKGVLGGVAGNDVLVETAEGTLTLPFAAIADAKLVLTDKLIEEDLRARKG